MNKLFILWSMVLLLGSCTNYLAEEDLDSEANSDSKEEIPMTLQVRSAPQGTMSYPIDVYIFNHSGKEVRHNTITSSRTNFDLRLPSGEYELSAFTGLDSKLYHIEESPQLNSYIKTESCRPCPTPIQYGYTSFNLKEPKELSINLSYIVSSLDFKFQDIPSDVTSVEVGITPTSQAYSFDGKYSNDNFMCRIGCQHVGNEWVAGPVYILPSNKNKTTLTLFIDRPTGEESLSYTYTSPLEACQPYQFCGKYNEGISLKGNFEVKGWLPGINVDFDFTENGQGILPDEPGEDDNHTVPNSSILYCNTLPEAGDFYEDFYIWKKGTTTDTESNAIIMSKKQWFNILAVDGPALLKEYDGLGLTEWRVFTKEEAKAFNAEFAQTLPALNGKLRQHNQDEFYFYNGERYLCNDCLSAFNAKGDDAVRKVGQKQTYYMRAIKNVTFKLHK